MSNRTLLAAELARRIPALQADSVVNNEALIKGLIEQYLGPERPPVRQDYALAPHEPRNLSHEADWINNPVPVPAFER